VIKSGDKAAVIPATEEKKVSDEMPPTYDEAKSLTTVDTAVKITNNETKVDMGKEKGAEEGFQGLTKEELMKYANDPYWVRLRWFLFILFWLIWVAMLVVSIVIIVYAKKCPSPEPKQWWQKSPLYKVDVGKLSSSDENVQGEVVYIQTKKKLDYLVETGVGTVYLSAFLKSSGAATDYQAVAPEFGNLEDWKALVQKFKERDQRVVIDFDPNHTSDNHEWFEKSVGNDPIYKDYYIWNAGGGNADSPPNDWNTTSGDSAWTWREERGEFYLHQFGPNKPDLNLENKAVVEELENVLKFWINTGVNGFVVNDVPYMVDAPISENNDHNISRQAGILKTFRTVVDAETEDSGIPCVLYANVDLPNKEVSELYGKNITGPNIGTLVHLPLSPTLLASSSAINASTLKAELDQYMLHDLKAKASTQTTGLVFPWPSFTLSSTKFGEEFVDPLTMFKMLLPGTSLTIAGEELGLDSMNWDAVKAQREGKEATLSHLKLYSTLAKKLRHQDAILFGEMNENSTFVKEDVFGMTRVKKGNPGYILLINFGDVDSTVDVSAVKHIPENIRLMERSIELGGPVQGVETIDPEKEIKRFESKSVPVKAKEGKIFTFVPKFEKK